MNAARRCFALLLATAMAAPMARSENQPVYKSLVPVVSVQLSSLSDAVRFLYDGLSGIGVETSASDCSRRLAEALMLPTLDGADRTKPVCAFLLSRDPPTATPEQAVILPVRIDGGRDLLRSLRSRYSFVEGGSIKICSSPKDGNAIEPLYVAIAEGNAMISPDIEAIRWMAYRLQSRSVPNPPSFRKTTLLASVNCQVLGQTLDFFDRATAVSTNKTAAVEKSPIGIRETSAFISSFAQIDFAVGSSIKQFDVAARLAPQEGAMSSAFRALTKPADKWTDSFSPLSCNNAVSAIPGFIAALPLEIRRWLANLADNTRLLGFQILPAALDLDEQLRPLMADIGLSSFIVDKPGGRVGAVSIFSLRSPSKADAVLRGYFAGKGAAGNPAIQNVDVRNGGAVITYDLAQGGPEKNPAGVGNSGASLSRLFNLNHVELAVKEDRLIVAKGSTRLINQWLGDKPPSSWNAGIDSITGIFPPQTGETVLGGGALEPVFLAKKIVEASPSISYLAPKMPHAGNGIAWRMSRGDGDVIFDVRLYSNEILAANMLRELDSSTMQELLAQLVLRHFRLSEEGRERYDAIREALKQFGGK